MKINVDTYINILNVKKMKYIERNTSNEFVYIIIVL